MVYDMFRKSLLVLTVSASTSAALPAIAQDDKAPVAAETAAPGNPVENPLAAMMVNVTNVATSLQQTVDELSANIEKSSSSSEEGAKMLDEMLAAARAVNESLDKDSEVWTQLNNLLDEWTRKRDDLLARAGDNPGLKDPADIMQKRVEDATGLRTQILDQASASRVLVDDIEAQREVVLAYYDVGATDAVLESMRKMADQLGTMNADMKTILDQAGVVSGVEGVAQN